MSTSLSLSAEQQLAFDKYVQGKNIFITGPGGSGKSALIRKIYLDALQRHKAIQVCALTGCAAVLLNVKAKTLHSWSGIGLGNRSLDSTVLKISKNKFSREAWKNTQILVVDEVSMLSLKLFHMLNEVGQFIRRDRRPFGGIQVIFCGDFYQLPPVGHEEDIESQQFCFESELWNHVFTQECQIQLIKIFRQTDDTYCQILNQVREGRIKRKSNDLLHSFVGREYSPDLIVEPTKLFPTRNKVDSINTEKMNALPGPAVTFTMRLINAFSTNNMSTTNNVENDTSDIKKVILSSSSSFSPSSLTKDEIERELEYMAKGLICDEIITLKVGAQVMCIINIPAPDDPNALLLCNGSQGIVTSFCELTGLPRVRFNNGKEIIMGRHTWESEKIRGVGISQIPLILAWAITIHKSQGATLDAAEIDVGSDIFECGQTYVALSRVKGLEGLYLTSFDTRRIKINRKVKEFYDHLTNSSV